VAFAEQAELAARLSLKDDFSSKLGSAEKGLNKFSSSTDRATTHSQRLGKIGGGVMKAGLLGVGAAAAIAVTGITAGVFAIKRWADEGADAAKQQLLLDRQIEKSGKVSKAQAAAINEQAGALLNLTGVDDDAIKGADAMLLRFGATGDQVLKLTPLILDLSKAQGISLEAATKAVGKALNGNAGALGKYGIVVDKAKLKTDAFGTTQDALTKKVGGTAAAMGKTLPGQLDIMRERMANVREEAGQRLAPSLLRLVTVVASKGIPVFQKLVERVLPLMEKGINLVTDALDKAGGPGGSSFFTKLGDIPFDSIAGGMKITAQATKTLVDAFLALPPDVQKIAVAALAVNKLSGGLVTSGIGGLLKLGLGGLKTITAGSVTVVGAKVGGAGVGGAAGTVGATSTGSKIGSVLGKVAIVGEVIGLVAAVEGVRESIGAGNSALATEVHDQTKTFPRLEAQQRRPPVEPRRHRQGHRRHPVEPAQRARPGRRPRAAQGDAGRRREPARQQQGAGPRRARQRSDRGRRQPGERDDRPGHHRWSPRHRQARRLGAPDPARDRRREAGDGRRHERGQRVGQGERRPHQRRHPLEQRRERRREPPPGGGHQQRPRPSRRRGQPHDERHEGGQRLGPRQRRPHPGRRPQHGCGDRVGDPCPAGEHDARPRPSGRRGQPPAAPHRQGDPEAQAPGRQRQHGRSDLRQRVGPAGP
jgi:hypothetical protein